MKRLILPQRRYVRSRYDTSPTHVYPNYTRNTKNLATNAPGANCIPGVKEEL